MSADDDITLATLAHTHAHTLYIVRELLNYPYLNHSTQGHHHYDVL